MRRSGRLSGPAQGSLPIASPPRPCLSTLSATLPNQAPVAEDSAHAVVPCRLFSPSPHQALVCVGPPKKARVNGLRRAEASPLLSSPTGFGRPTRSLPLLVGGGGMWLRIKRRHQPWPPASAEGSGAAAAIRRQPPHDPPLLVSRQRQQASSKIHLSFTVKLLTKAYKSGYNFSAGGGNPTKNQPRPQGAFQHV